MRVTVIATGFERTGMPRRVREVPVSEPRDYEDKSAVPQPAVKPSLKEFQPRAFNTEDLDIPTFLRNRTH